MLRLRPFQQLRVRMQIGGSAGPDVEHEIRARVVWPLLTFGPQEYVLSATGSRTFTISHEALRLAYAGIQQIPMPQVPGVSSDATAAQCLQMVLVVNGSTELVTTEVQAQATGQVQYSLTIEPE